MPEISNDLLMQLREEESTKVALARNAATQVGIEAASLNREKIQHTSTAVSHRLDDWKATSQKKSGRCWLFSSLNFLRSRARESLGIKNFEFSQSYVFFWDKFERANWFLTDIIATSDEPVDGRLVQFLLGDVLGDGGQWDMAVSVYMKYGLVPKEIVDATASHVRLESFIAAQEFYPWPLTARLDLRLDPESGLNIELSTKNLGDSPAPYGASLHPYLLGGTTADDSILSLPASQIVDTDENLLPTGINPVSTAYDFRVPRMVDDLFIDHCYGGLQGNWQVRVTNAQGEGAALASNTPWVQIHTADALGRPGIAVEPMTCPPDAFNSGIDLVSLAPGQRHRLFLSIRGL